MENRSKIDELSANCDYIIEFCSRNQNELNKSIVENCNRLVRTGQVVHRIAFDYLFENIPENGFLIYLEVITSYTRRIVNQIKAKNDFNRDFIKLFSMIEKYSKFILFLHQKLTEEEEEEEEEEANNSSCSKSKKLLIKQCIFGSKEVYDCFLAINDEVGSISFGVFPGFYLPVKFQKIMKLLNFSFALTYKLPLSASSVFSSKLMGKYSYKVLKNTTIDSPFDKWHQTEGFMVSKLLNSLVNLKVPVKSVTIHLPKQYRFRLTHQGNILDFETLTNEEIEQYFDDKVEQDRHNASGRRHRNKHNIECRYSYVTNKEKAIESLNLLKQTNQTYDLIKYHSARKSSNESSKSSDYDTNQIEKLNIYKTKDLIRQKLELKSKKFKNARYNGPKYLDNVRDDLNTERTLIIYLHGGGFVSQGPRSCELYLRQMVAELGGIPMLAINYSLTVPFPVQTQEILDIYLWILSRSDDVRSILGFEPERVILFGDSAGSYIGLSLSIAVNEMNKKFNFKIRQPSALVFAYPCFSLNCMTPSRALSVLEPLLAVHPLFLVISIFGSNLSTNADYEKLNQTEDSIKNKSLNARSRPYFQCDYETYRKRAEYLGKQYNHSMIAPIIYEHFDELKDIDLYIVVGAIDLLLDDSIEVSRRWKGNLSLDVISSMIHGFLYYNHIFKECEDSTKLTLRRLQEACGLL